MSFISCSAKERIDASAFYAFRQMLGTLEGAKDSNDSIRIIQRFYIDKIRKRCNPFLKEKNIEAVKLYNSLILYPNFYNQLAKYEINVKSLNDTIRFIDKKFKESFDEYEEPSIVLLVGDLSVGGAVSKTTIYICLDMISDNGVIDKSELPEYMKNICAKGTLFCYLVHEIVHSMQYGFPMNELFGMIKHNKNSLLYACLLEGSADYIADHLFNTFLNKNLSNYYEKNIDVIWIRFNQNVNENPFEYNQWIYYFTPNDERPADLGYYIGYKICEAFMNKQTDKKRGIKSLINRRKYRDIFNQSEFVKK